MTQIEKRFNYHAYTGDNISLRNIVRKIDLFYFSIMIYFSIKQSFQNRVWFRRHKQLIYIYLFHGRPYDRARGSPCNIVHMYSGLRVHYLDGIRYEFKSR